MKRSGPLRRRTRLQASQSSTKAWHQRSRAPLPKVSAKRRRENRERRRVLLERFGPNPRCHACEPIAAAGFVTGCSGWADDGHEVLSRARGGSIVDPSNVLPVGRACHRWITEHDRKAQALGLSLASTPGT